MVSSAVHMMEAPEPLVGDLLSWLRSEPRLYAEVMDAWRTSCPKLPIWEDALDSGLIERRNNLVFITEAGKEWLSAANGSVGGPEAAFHPRLPSAVDPQLT